MFAYQLLQNIQPNDGGGDDDPEVEEKHRQGQLVDPVGQEGDVREWDRGHSGGWSRCVRVCCLNVLPRLRRVDDGLWMIFTRGCAGYTYGTSECTL